MSTNGRQPWIDPRTAPGGALIPSDRVSQPDRPEPTMSRSDRTAVATLAVVIVVGFVALVADIGRYYWFNGDEWQFLANREIGGVGDLLDPHNEHLVAVPLLAYRTMFTLFGLSSYVPYQIPVITLHLTAVVLIWLVMRRCSVRPWLATAAASVFVLFGPGEENIIWAFQIGFTGSLVLGLGHLLLADHDGPISRRDYLGLGLGFIGLASSGIAPLLTVVVGAVMLVRRGLRPALFHTVPLAVAYLSWFVFIGPEVISDPYGRSADLGEIAHFVWTGLVATFEGLGGQLVIGGVAVVAVLWAVVLVSGLFRAYVGLTPRLALDRAVMPVGLALAGLALLIVSGYGRWWIGPEVGGSSRYVHLAAALILPALAVAIDALTDRWPVAAVAAAVLLVSVIPHNIDRFENNDLFTEGYFDRQERLLVSLANSPFADVVPAETRPDPVWTPVSIGWITDLRDAGDLPDVDFTPDPAEPLLFGLSQLVEPNPFTNCETITEPIDLALSRGDELGVVVGPSPEPQPGWFLNRSYTVQLLADGQPVGRAHLRSPDGGGELLRVEIDTLEVRMALAGSTESVIVCRP